MYVYAFVLKKAAERRRVRSTWTGSAGFRIKQVQPLFSHASGCSTFYYFHTCCSSVAPAFLNALRRTSVSRLEALAITAARIEGCKHEFYSIAGVREDIVDDIFNSLTRIIFKEHSFSYIDADTAHREAAIAAAEAAAAADAAAAKQGIPLSERQAAAAAAGQRAAASVIPPNAVLVRRRSLSSPLCLSCRQLPTQQQSSSCWGDVLKQHHHQQQQQNTQQLSQPSYQRKTDVKNYGICDKQVDARKFSEPAAAQQVPPDNDSCYYRIPIQKAEASFEKPLRAKLRVRGPLVVVAGHLQLPPGIEILNVNEYLFTVDAGYYVNMDVKIERIREYVLPESGYDSLQRDVDEDGFIYFPNFVSPVPIFAFSAERRGEAVHTSWHDVPPPLDWKEAFSDIETSEGSSNREGTHTDTKKQTPQLQLTATAATGPTSATGVKAVTAAKTRAGGANGATRGALAVAPGDIITIGNTTQDELEDDVKAYACNDGCEESEEEYNEWKKSYIPGPRGLQHVLLQATAAAPEAVQPMWCKAVLKQQQEMEGRKQTNQKTRQQSTEKKTLDDHQAPPILQSRAPTSPGPMTTVPSPPPAPPIAGPAQPVAPPGAATALTEEEATAATALTEATVAASATSFSGALESRGAPTSPRPAAIRAAPPVGAAEAAALTEDISACTLSSRSVASGAAQDAPDGGPQSPLASYGGAEGRAGADDAASTTAAATVGGCGGDSSSDCSRGCSTSNAATTLTAAHQQQKQRQRQQQQQPTQQQQEGHYQHQHQQQQKSGQQQEQEEQGNPHQKGEPQQQSSPQQTPSQQRQQQKCPQEGLSCGDEDAARGYAEEYLANDLPYQNLGEVVTLEVQTDGSITPREALVRCCDDLTQQTLHLLHALRHNCHVAAIDGNDEEEFEDPDWYQDAHRWVRTIIKRHGLCAEEEVQTQIFSG